MDGVSEILGELNAVLDKHGVALDLWGYDCDLELTDSPPVWSQRKTLARLLISDGKLMNVRDLY